MTDEEAEIEDMHTLARARPHSLVPATRRKSLACLEGLRMRQAEKIHENCCAFWWTRAAPNRKSPNKSPARPPSTALHLIGCQENYTKKCIYLNGLAGSLWLTPRI